MSHFIEPPMETSFADDQAARFARIEETRALADQITELAGHIERPTIASYL